MDGIRAAQDRMLGKRFGIFNHFLYGEPSDNAQLARTRKGKPWNERVAELDVPALAKRVHETGAGYYFITVMQGTKHMLAPNAAYDRIAGTRPGEACPERDVIMELADELAKYDIDLYLYYTGDGPHLDPVIGARFGYLEPHKVGDLTMEFVEKWAGALKEYAVRYGDKVKGWWIDGCYRENYGYTDEFMKPLYEACKAGNPNGLIAMNNGVKLDFEKNYPQEELVCGEFNDFEKIPASRFIDGAQAHILAPIGKGEEGNEWSRWRSRGTQRDADYMVDYIRRANAAGMPVTIDAFIDSDGNWDGEQFELLKEIGRRL